MVKKFKEEYREESKQARKENYREFYKEKLPERYMAKILYEWDNRRFDQKYWGWLERNWRY